MGCYMCWSFSDAPGYPTPGAGKVVRVTRSGAIQDVVTGLAVPTGMTFGPDRTAVCVEPWQCAAGNAGADSTD